MLAGLVLQSSRRTTSLCSQLATATLKNATPLPKVLQPKLSSGLLRLSRGFSSLTPRLRQSVQGATKIWKGKMAAPLVSALRQTANSAVIRAYPEISARAEKIVGRWLLTCAGMCAATVVIGGITRLTDSGLSITDWKPITGSLPPMNPEAWEEEFEKYKSFPEYRYLERELTLDQFKNIFYIEWFHRFWGRCIGLAVAIPAAYFWKKGYLAKAMKPRVLVYIGMVAFQGFLGWYMVQSGLKDDPDNANIPRVSQYRLAAHLSSALVLYSLLLWSGMTHMFHKNAMPKGATVAQLSRVAKYCHGAMAMVFLTATTGAFVAGLDAGLVYNSWPKMADQWFPTDLWSLSPKWKNIFENGTTVQFNHRHMGEMTGLAITALWFVARKTPLPPQARLAANALMAMAVVQISLGISTLLNYVPTSLAATHQTGSLVLLSFALWLTHELKRIAK